MTLKGPRLIGRGWRDGGGTGYDDSGVSSAVPARPGSCNMARFLIGIDLGTTNSALAYVDLQRAPRSGGKVDLKPFPVPQLVAPGDVKERALLPSFLYIPGPHDLP